MDINIKVEFNELAKSVSGTAKIDVTFNTDETLNIDEVTTKIDELKELQLAKAKELFNEVMSYSSAKTQLKQ
jgi:D-alanyl-D-alanine dipeptidase